MEFTEAEVAAFKSEYAKGATDVQFDLFLGECKARNLRPGAHLVFQLRNSKERDPDTGATQYVKKPYWITTIGALRLIALRTGQYGGSRPPEYIYLDEQGDPTLVSQIPLPSKQNRALPREPWAVRVSVKRKDFDEPITSIVRFDAVASTYKNSDKEIVLTDMWTKRGAEQNAKCTEADALRKAFPEELGSLYLSEELKVEEDAHPTAVTPASVVPLPPSVPKVDQTPAVGTDAPRPNENSLEGKPFTVKASGVLPAVAVEYHVTGVPATLPEHSGSVLVVKDAAKEKALAAVPDLKPASEIPPPEKKKGGRPKKESPVNGRDIASEGGITDADIANSGPAPETVDQTPVAEAFVEALDPTPTQEEMKGFTARVRTLTAKGIKSDYVKSRVLAVGGVEDTKQVTVRAWKQALDELEAPSPEKPLGEF